MPATVVAFGQDRTWVEYFYRIGANDVNELNYLNNLNCFLLKAPPRAEQTLKPLEYPRTQDSQDTEGNGATKDLLHQE